MAAAVRGITSKIGLFRAQTFLIFVTLAPDHVRMDHSERSRTALSIA